AGQRAAGPAGGRRRSRGLVRTAAREPRRALPQGGRPGAILMSRDWMADWLDNPIFVKHFRSRLRRQPLISSIVITVVLCLCIAWGGYQLGAFLSGRAFGTLLGLQSLILAIMGAAQVGTSVTSARASGILDFHRVSPLTPAELTLGFFFGAPIREYLL